MLGPYCSIQSQSQFQFQSNPSWGLNSPIFGVAGLILGHRAQVAGRSFMGHNSAQFIEEIVMHGMDGFNGLMNGMD